MAGTYAVSVDLKGIKAFREMTDKLTADQFARVKTRAIGTLRRRAQTEVVRLLGDELNLKKSDIRNRITLSSGSDYVAIAGSATGVPLAKFGGKWTGIKSPGATAQIFKDGPRRTYKSAYIGRSGNILARALKGTSGKRYPRLPVVVLRGPSIGGLLIDTGPRQVAGPLIALARDVLSAEIDRLLKVELG